MFRSFKNLSDSDLHTNFEDSVTLSGNNENIHDTSPEKIYPPPELQPFYMPTKAKKSRPNSGNQPKLFDQNVNDPSLFTNQATPHKTNYDPQWHQAGPSNAKNVPFWSNNQLQNDITPYVFTDQANLNTIDGWKAGQNAPFWPENHQQSNRPESHGLSIYALEAFEKGNNYYIKHQYEKAEETYTLAIQAACQSCSDLMVLLEKRGNASYNLYKNEECLKDYDAVIELVNNYIEAKAEAPSLLAKSGKSFVNLMVSVLYKKACALESLERYQDSISVYNQIISVDKQEKKQADDFLKNCQLALYRKNGRNFHANGQYKEAEASFTKALEILPNGHCDLVLFLYYRSKTLLSQHNYKGVVEDCNYGIRIADKMIERKEPTTFLHKIANYSFSDLLLHLLRFQAQALEQLRDYIPALEAYDRISSIQKSDTEATAGASRCRLLQTKREGRNFFDQGKYPEAEKSFTNAINLLPQGHDDLILLLIYRAKTYFKLSKYSKSLNDSLSAFDMADNHLNSNRPVPFLIKHENRTVKEQKMRALYYRARASEIQGRYVAAASIYNDLLHDNYGGDVKIRLKKCQQLMQSTGATKPGDGNDKQEKNGFDKEAKGKDLNDKRQEQSSSQNKDKVNEELARWKKGKEQDLVGLLSTLDKISWREIQVDTRGVSTPEEWQDIYKKVIDRVSPVLHNQLLPIPKYYPSEKILLAQGIYPTLKKSWETFKLKNKLSD